MNQHQLESDLSYVRNVVQRAENPKSPPYIYYFWAIVCLPGFAIADFSPEYTGMFWMVAGPGGWLVSALLARAHGRKTGELNKKLGQRYGMHWAGLLAAILLLMVGVAKGTWSADSAGQLILLVLSLTYFLAGIHLDRALIWISLVMVAGYLALFFLSGPIWTITGAIVALSLALTPWLESRANDHD